MSRNSYAKCEIIFERSLSPLADQELGGLLTWIPAAMMSGVGLLVVLRHALHESRPIGAAAQSAATTPIS
jgi:putative membrane protein